MLTLKMTQSSRGIASLPVVLLLGGLIIEIAVAGAFIFYYINSNVYGTRLSNQAAAAARAAIDDAILRVILDPSCGGISTCAATYQITTGAATADVTLCKDTCTDPALAITDPDHQIGIIAIGRASTKKHRIVSVLNVSASGPLITVGSIIDIPE